MSGDTAVPMPERKTGTVPDPTTKLTDDQLRRIEALQIARQALEQRPGLFAGSKIEATSRVVFDLTYLADWIIDGPDATRDLEPTEYIDVLNGAGELVVRIPVACPGSAADDEADADLRAARSDADDGV
jgi:hypothetical protein